MASGLNNRSHGTAKKRTSLGSRERTYQQRRNDGAYRSKENSYRASQTQNNRNYSAKTSHNTNASGSRERTKASGNMWQRYVVNGSKGEMDYTFLTIVIAVLAMGLVMLLSASSPRGSSMEGNSYFFFNRQLAFAAAGVAGMIIISRIDYRTYRELSTPIMIVCIVLLVLVLIPGIGVKRNGARRWLFGVVQPSEFVKPAVAMMFAHQITKRGLNMKKVLDVLPLVLFLGIIALLMILEPHVSGLLIIVGIAAVIMIAAGLPVMPVLILGVVAIVAVVGGCYMFSPTRWERILSFLDPFRDQQGNSYQIVQSIYSIGSGGITGLGLGQSVQKFNYLPEPYNDFIFAIVCEELGLIGAIGVIALFCALVVRGVRIAMNAPDKYSMLFATGIIAQVAIQSALNIAVAIGAVPNTGASLPFFSYGGTSVFTLLCEMGVLLNISRQSKTNYKPI